MNHPSGLNINEAKVFIWVLIATSVVFALILLPFASPIFWACVLAVLFHPVHNWLLPRLNGSKNLAALLALLVAILIVVIPVSILLITLAAEAAEFYRRIAAGEFKIGQYFDQITNAFPVIQQKLESLQINVDSLKEQLQSFLAEAANFVTKQSLQIGQNTLSFFINFVLMLYMTFFFLRDGPRLLLMIKVAFPMDDARESHLFERFSEVARATVKGNLVVGMVQGALGGLIFWFLGVGPAILWGACMAVASLIPAVGTGLIWVPVAVYLFAVGETMDGIILTAFASIVIGLADNVLRPILVGRDTRLPDYVVLITTFGGFALVGLQGFIVGPLVAVLFFSLWNMFIAEFNPDGAALLEAESTSLSTPKSESKGVSD